MTTKKLLSVLTFSLILMACSSLAKDEVKEFIPGTYIRASESEFGKSWDTLNITLQNGQAKQYKITRRWKYNRVLDGKPIEPEYKVTETSGVYDAEQKRLQESETLEIFTFDTKENLLFNGANKFTKIK